MRQYIDIVEQNNNETYISAHIVGNFIWIDMMWVPAEKRGTGVGRRYYEEWERKLPNNIELVRLMAADTGDGLSDGFWHAMGFEFVYDGEIEDIGYEDYQQMWKGVNGHPTPAPIVVDGDDY